MMVANNDDYCDIQTNEKKNAVKESSEEESSIDLRNHLRDDILEAVDECLNAWKRGKASDFNAADSLDRCIVCTLPHGTCQHTEEWLDQRDEQSILKTLPKDNVDLVMDDISDVLQQAPIDLENAGSKSLAPSLSTLHWDTLTSQPADELAGKPVDLSSPALRAWHSMVQLNGSGSLREDTRLLILFGGVSNASGEPMSLVRVENSGKGNGNKIAPCDGDTTTSNGQQALTYHADVRVFHVGLSTWHHPGTVGDLPEGRCGHVALALTGELMWMFGGRLKGGQQEGDTYILDVRSMRWEKTNAICPEGRSPAPRVWSAAAKVRETVVLFGGTDERSGQIFDDVWTWDIMSQSWTEQIVVGSSPLPRYGHALVACSEGQVLILGGCCVSRVAEEGLPKDCHQLQRRVCAAVDNVNHAYELEEAQVTVGALANLVELNDHLSTDPHRSTDCKGPTVPVNWRDLSRGQAQLAAVVAARERETTLKEEQLHSALHEQAASTYWAELQSRHPLRHLDGTFLDTDSMIWGANVPTGCSASSSRSGIRTPTPTARMHFSAVAIGDKVIVWGGCLPTTKTRQAADDGVYVFDIAHGRWTRILGAQYPEGILPRMKAAKGRVRRAARSLFEAKQRAMTIGAPGGRTMQVSIGHVHNHALGPHQAFCCNTCSRANYGRNIAPMFKSMDRTKVLQAEAVTAVNRWRVELVADEIRKAMSSPQPRAAHAGCAVGHRVMYFGGWGAEAGEKNGELLVLDVEQASEKERRLQKEFHQRLERERQIREESETATLRRTAMQEKMRKELEQVREAQETAEMTAEDARSAIPELTMAPTPHLRCANSTTLWLAWDRPTVDAVGNLPGDLLEYTLHMRGGFLEWQAGDAVLVEYLSRAERKTAVVAASSATTTSTAGSMGIMTQSISSVGATVGLPRERSSDNTTGFARRGEGDDGRENDGNREDEDDHNIRESELNSKQVPQEERRPRLLPAVITASAGGGFYDIRWDDGERECGVYRYRIHRKIPPMPPWVVIYHGTECGYAVEGMIPAAVLEREHVSPYEVSADFSLQTKGTEVPRGKLSQHSPVATYSTSYSGHGPCMADSRDVSGGARARAILKSRLATAKALDHSISSTAVTSSNCCSSAHSLHGQYTGTGEGGLYL